MAAKPPLLRLDRVSKEFDGVSVLKDVSFGVDRGEIVALVGENGAGKSTLMRIIFGMPDIAATGGYGGEVLIDGEPARFKGPSDALAAGIGMVHQEFSLVPGFTAAENIVLNREKTKPGLASLLFGPRLSPLDRRAMRDEAERAVSRLGVRIDPGTDVAEMPVSHMQFTEIAREIDRSGARLLVMDEPTAVLSESEAEVLLASLRRLASEGIGIIFISHRLAETLSVADRIVVLRDGAVVADEPARALDVKGIVRWMVGRDVAASTGKSPSVAGARAALSVRNLWVDMPGETVRDASFDVLEGEIFGIAGLAGQGKAGIPNGLMGVFPAGGAVEVLGKPLALGDSREAMAAGMAFVSEDRRGSGLLLEEGLDWNIAFAAMQAKGLCLKRFAGGLFSFRDAKAMRELAERYIASLDVKCRGPRQPARELSGGNQQKICLAKAFALEPAILLVSEPTRGIDVGAKALVLDALRKANRERGTTIVIASSELEELRSICGRIAVVNEGRIAGILDAGADPVEFGLLMSGAEVRT